MISNNTAIDKVFQEVTLWLNTLLNTLCS